MTVDSENNVLVLPPKKKTILTNINDDCDELIKLLNLILSQKEKLYEKYDETGEFTIILGIHLLKIIKRSNFTWSLSQLVFPHQMVRLILAEQVYRACTILRNEKYHHC